MHFAPLYIYARLYIASCKSQFASPFTLMRIAQGDDTFADRLCSASAYKQQETSARLGFQGAVNRILCYAC